MHALHISAAAHAELCSVNVVRAPPQRSARVVRASSQCSAVKRKSQQVTSSAAALLAVAVLSAAEWKLRGRKDSPPAALVSGRQD
jgi:hypothetical protein